MRRVESRRRQKAREQGVRKEAASHLQEHKPAILSPDFDPRRGRHPLNVFQLTHLPVLQPPLVHPEVPPCHPQRHDAPPSPPSTQALSHPQLLVALSRPHGCPAPPPEEHGRGRTLLHIESSSGSPSLGSKRAWWWWGSFACGGDQKDGEEDEEWASACKMHTRLHLTSRRARLIKIGPRREILKMLTNGVWSSAHWVPGI